MGVSGSGKTTVAELIHDRTGFPYAEADEFHPTANKDKMSAGIPLDDDDRWPWLRTIRDWATDHAYQGSSTVITCSALKKPYRELLSSARGDVIFFELDADRDTLEARMSGRSGHFMPTSLLDSQLRDLEPLGPASEGSDSTPP
jgi:gluconate kinase, SKI family (EC 2.7.1.12)